MLAGLRLTDNETLLRYCFVSDPVQCFDNPPSAD